MDDLLAHLVVEKIPFALLPRFFIVYQCFDQLWIIFELRVYYLYVLLVLAHELSKLDEGGPYLFSEFPHCF